MTVKERLKGGDASGVRVSKSTKHAVVVVSYENKMILSLPNTCRAGPTDAHAFRGRNQLLKTVNNHNMWYVIRQKARHSAALAVACLTMAAYRLVQSLPLGTRGQALTANNTESRITNQDKYLAVLPMTIFVPLLFRPECFHRRVYIRHVMLPHTCLQTYVGLYDHDTGGICSLHPKDELVQNMKCGFWHSQKAHNNNNQE